MALGGLPAMLLMLAVGASACGSRSKLSELKMQSGDQIACRLYGLIGNDHWMLATEDGNLIQAWTRSDPKGWHIAEYHYTSLISFDAFNTNKCTNWGQGPRGGMNAVRLARKLLSRETVYYHLLTCNCEHYVKHWAGANIHVNQAGAIVSKYCDVWSD